MCRENTPIIIVMHMLLLFSPPFLHYVSIFENWRKDWSFVYSERSKKYVYKSSLPFSFCTWGKKIWKNGVICNKHVHVYEKKLVMLIMINNES